MQPKVELLHTLYREAMDLNCDNVVQTNMERKG